MPSRIGMVALLACLVLDSGSERRATYGQTPTPTPAPVVIDIDGDGDTDPLTDGVLMLRFLFGFSGGALITGVVDPDDCSRCTAMDIEAYLAKLDTATTLSPSCDWSGTRFASSGWDGACAFVAGVRITCSDGKVTQMEYVSSGGCPAVQ